MNSYVNLVNSIYNVIIWLLQDSKLDLVQLLVFTVA